MHLNKYHKETLHELEMIEKRKQSPTHDIFEMLDYVHEQTKNAKKIVKQMRKPSPPRSSLLSSKK